MRSARWLALLGLWACTDAEPPAEESRPAAPEPETDSGAPAADEDWAQPLTVLLDGVPVEGALVIQGGVVEGVRTDANGAATVAMDLSVIGSKSIMAAHPDARIVGVELSGPTADLVLEMARFDRSDNEDYVFQDPGTPERNGSTDLCSHCHVRMVDDWYGSAHRTSASSSVVHDVYSGTAAVLDAAACGDAGGVWVSGRIPGGGEGDRCRIGAGTLPDLDPACGDGDLCDDAVAFGGCADCHAPGIDGQIGGRDLLHAEGIAYEAGVHCDVCHKVASVDLEAEQRGVAGALEIVRPTEPPLLSVEDFRGLTFGPLPDVPNPRMGSAWAPDMHDGTLCAGCHELEQAALVPGAEVDLDRWPTGRIPVHSTWSEWSAGPLEGVASCPACHMPPDPAAGNSADIDLLGASLVGWAPGWWRPPGNSHRHLFAGPRTDGVDMLGLAATVSVEVDASAEQVTATATVRHTGPGHALPTGDPFRQLLVSVVATCDGEPLAATGGDAIPAFVGARASRPWGEASAPWPDALVGDVLRVVHHEGWRDYDGFGPFGGRFTPSEKGLPDARVAGHAVVVATSATGELTLDRPLPEGDEVHLARPGELSAGAAGFAFARVLADGEGKRMVPHHAAVDVVSDNRLLPGQPATTSHVFEGCASPTVRATVLYRAYPAALARERGWANPDRVVAEVVR